MSKQIEIDVVQSFMDVVVRCLRATVGMDAVVAAIREPRGPVPTITVALDLSGDIQGPVMWVFPPEVALELVRRLLADPDPHPDSVADGATELANILIGSATSVLEENGFRCELGVPRVHAGALPSGIEVRVATVAGPIDVVLSLSPS